MNAVTRLYREAGEAKDIDALMSALAPAVVFRSPLSARAGFAGHAQVRQLFTVALGVLRDLRYHTDVGDDRTRMLTATARLGRHELEEAALVRLGGDGLIEEVTMWIRPLPALTAMMAALGPGLARAAGRPALAAFAGASARPLAFMTDFGDRTLVPLISPKSG
ncbi:nuclear transport factor 2 family protein [Planomonospora venezuelensis]|uniref:SnoaL-like domain-containing protein n=1 Tax=Planomonospora venezuelensis TaxID=1999 RepID=A0A841D4Z8_PLAVE|nr:nuclear transport factor 2 family protein [Planomonospora venezuelensis]MBB5962526.1 hypothetical protein [Planomonospora venezuelensis]GIM99071.1 hypothetical protein Pve01_07300 [Planomonospora venezuelensis]